MDGWDQQGQEVAKTRAIKQRGNLWIVLSHSREDPYGVDVEAQQCICRDLTMRCPRGKHFYAAGFCVQKEIRPDGSTVTKTFRVAYRQKGPTYNTAQTEEKRRLPNRPPI